MRWHWIAVWAGLVAACGSSRSVDDDGSNGDNGPNTEVDAGECGGFTACGGDLVGRWRYAWTCEDPNEADPFDDPACADSTHSETSTTDMTADFRADGTVVFDGSSSSVADFTITDACALATIGMDATWYCSFSDPRPGPNPSRECHVENGICTCHVVSTSTVEEQTRTYLVMGNQFAVSDENGYGSPADYCVAGNQLFYGFGSSRSYEVLARE